MRLVLVHNHYQQRGGEDQVFGAEAALLEARGHAVTRYTVHNDDVADMGRLALAQATVWNGEQYRKLRELFQAVRPDVVHVHNTLPLISPAVYYAAKAEGAAVVQTLHNYRLSCVNGLFFRDGRVCEDCLGKIVPFPGVLHGCYRNSRMASAVVAAMLSYHNLRGTYRDQVDTYIALTEFARDKFIVAGLPAEKIVVKPNFLDEDPGFGEGRRGYALFVGRLSPEKGLNVLLAAWRHIGAELPLRVVGDGPLAGAVASWAAGVEGVTLLGRLPSPAVMEEMRGASVLVIPSLSFETFGMTTVEAFAVGTPVLASNLGAMAESVDDGRTGLRFTPGDASDLVRAVRWVIENPEEVRAMRSAARLEYERKYSAATNYAQLMAIYRQALGN